MERPFCGCSGTAFSPPNSTRARAQARVYRDGKRIQSLAQIFPATGCELRATGHKAQKVRVTGYLLWDDDHNGSADVGSTVQWFSKNGFHHPWGSTAWEIHPVIKLEVIP
jgi:hypothetical protein